MQYKKTHCFLFPILSSLRYVLSHSSVYYKQTMNQTNQCQPDLGPFFDDNHKLPKPNSQIYHDPKTPKFSPYNTMYRCLSIFCFFFLLLILFASAHSGHDDSNDDSSENGSVNLQSKPSILVKIWCLILIFVGTFVGGVSPF